MKRVIAALGVVASVLLVAQPAQAYVVTPEVDQALASINQTRAAVGVCPLGLDPGLSDLAGRWSGAMAVGGRLSHNTDAIKAGHMVAENVGYGMNVAQVNGLFLRSPRHFANLTNPTFTSVGIGLVQSGPFTFVTYDFVSADGLDRRC